MKYPTRFATAAFAASILLVGCASLQSQDVSVTMTEGTWSADPVVFPDAGTLDITFVNAGSETHQPLLTSTDTSLAELEAHVEALGDTNLVDELAGAEVSGIGASLLYGTSGHFHPGGDDAIDPPSHARVDTTSEGDLETTHYLYSTPVGPGSELVTSVSISNFKGFDAETFAVVCMEPGHAGRGEYAVFGITE